MATGVSGFLLPGCCPEYACCAFLMWMAGRAKAGVFCGDVAGVFIRMGEDVFRLVWQEGGFAVAGAGERVFTGQASLVLLAKGVGRFAGGLWVKNAYNA